MKAPCTDSNDATCVCNYNYYMDELSQRCEPCTKCPLGQGMLLSCEFDHDTMCEECTVDTYSDQESSREPCIPCTTCDDGEMLTPCTPISDTVCQGKAVSSQWFIVKCVSSHSVTKLRPWCTPKCTSTWSWLYYLGCLLCGHVRTYVVGIYAWTLCMCYNIFTISRGENQRDRGDIWAKN